MLYAIPVKAAVILIHYGAKQYKIENKRAKDQCSDENAHHNNALCVVMVRSKW